MTEQPALNRRSLLKYAGLATVAVSGSSLLAACNSSSSSSPQAGSSQAATHKGGTLTVLVAPTALIATSNLDPATAITFPTEREGLIARRLTTWSVAAGQDCKFAPDLATTTGEPSNGGKTWTYKLKDGIKFQDGSPITSADIKYGIERSFSSQLSAGLSYHKTLLVGGSTYKGPYTGKGLDSIETPDDKTIVFHLTTPSGAWPWIVSTNPFTPVPKAKDTHPATYGQNPISSGPYQVDTNEDGKQTVLVRNPHWEPATDDVRTAGPDKIVFSYNQNIATSTQNLIQNLGDAQNSMMADQLGAPQLALVNGNADAKQRMATSQAGALYYLAINCQRPQLKDVRVRQALNYAIDRKAIIISQGGPQAADPATTILIPGTPGRADFDLYPGGDSGDAAKAKQLLQQGGYDGTELTFWVANDDASQAGAQAVQQGLKAAGINVKIEPRDPATMYGDLHTANPDFDIVYTWWEPDFPDGIGNIQLMFDSTEIGGGFNFSLYSNKQVDQMMASAAAQVDAAKSQQQWAAVDKRIMQDAPIAPLFFAKESFLHGGNVANADVPAYPPDQNYLIVSLTT